MGPAVMATTTSNTTDIGAVALGTNPSGTLPLIADTIGGSLMRAGPFPGFNPNFDITSVTISSTDMPIPAVIWLFSSSLVVLVGVARHRR